MNPLPRLIGICGNPKSGKSELQNVLEFTYGYIQVDDGAALREFSREWLGLSENDVYTQAGKARYSEILGKPWQHRDILGTLGSHLEAMFGEHIMPFMATRDLDPKRRYSFGSVRKTQGLFYKKQGGIIIEVRNPLAPPSPYDFDQYDRSIIDFAIDNDGLARGLPVNEARQDLEEKVAAVLTSMKFLDLPVAA